MIPLGDIQKDAEDIMSKRKAYFVDPSFDDIGDDNNIGGSRIPSHIEEEFDHAQTIEERVQARSGNDSLIQRLHLI